MTIIEFCDRHAACAEGRSWALEQGLETMAELWELPMRPDWRIWIATRPGVLTPQQLVAFACRCIRRIWHLLTDVRSRTAVEVAERWAMGESSAEELETYRAAISSRAARSSSISCATFTAAYAAYCAACATYAAHATYTANAAHAAAIAAVYAFDANAYDTERDWQARELVQMFGNQFRKEDDK